MPTDPGRSPSPVSRTALAATLGVLLLSLSGCGDGTRSGSSSTGTATAAPTTAAAATTATTETSPAEEIDYPADTKKACKRIDKLLEGKEMERFAKRLGQLIVYKQAGENAKAVQAREAAKKELLAVAAGMRRATGSAQDPELRAAGEESAADIEETAADNAFFAKLRTMKSIDKQLEKELVPWLTPLSIYCS